jgi:hypothetical protein
MSTMIKSANIPMTPEQWTAFKVQAVLAGLPIGKLLAQLAIEYVARRSAPDEPRPMSGGKT